MKFFSNLFSMNPISGRATSRNLLDLQIHYTPGHRIVGNYSRRFAASRILSTALPGTLPKLWEFGRLSGQAWVEDFVRAGCVR